MKNIVTLNIPDDVVLKKDVAPTRVRDGAVGW